METWRTGWAQSAALDGCATHEGRSAQCLPVFLVHKADSVTPKLG